MTLFSMWQRTGAPVAATAGIPAGEVVPVRPVRAAFGPHVSLVTIDEEGRLWVRFSTALSILIAGMALMAIPLLAFWYASAGLVDSGQVKLKHETSTSSFTTQQNRTPSTPGAPTVGQLPLAASGNTTR